MCYILPKMLIILNLRYAFTVMSNLLVYVITWCVLHINNESRTSQIGPADAPKFQSVVWIGLAVGILSSLIFHLSIKEESGYNSNNIRAGQLRISVRDILTNIEIYQVYN